MKIFALVISILFAALLPVAAPAGSFSAGLNISGEVAPEETGLRIYPGAKLVEKKSGDGDSAQVQFDFGDYGLKVVVAKLRSDDSPAIIAAFYRDELVRFGEVLDCADAKTKEANRPRDRKSRLLTCDGDKPPKNGMLFKAGSKSDQHVVDIRPKGEGSEFSLVHVVVRGAD